jgi:hypothetical protein
MEFKFNKIDTDIRRKIQEDIKEDKVHFSKKTSNNKDAIQEKEFEEKNKKKHNKDESIEMHKKYITVDGIKLKGHSIKIGVEKIENVNEMNSKGIILDTKK